MLTLRIIAVLLSVTVSFTSAQQLQNAFKHIGQPFITSFSARQYKAHPTNFAVAQDKTGILYFGNLWCILQFDGTLWRQIYLPNGSSCNALAIDNDGTIYAGGRNSIGYLTTTSTGEKQYVSLLDDLLPHERKFNEIWKIAVTKEGIFFASYEKLFFRNRETGKLQVIHRSPWYVFHVLGNTYVTDSNGLHHFKNGVIEKVPNSEVFDRKFINAITHLDGKLLISTSEEGLYLFDGKQAQRWNAPINQILKQFNPTRIENIRNEYLIISTELNGVFITDLQGNIISHFNKSNGLPANTVSSFFLDGNNILWMTTYNGIAHIPVFRNLSYINDYNGVSGVPYSSAVYDKKLFLATSEGLFSAPLQSPDACQRKFSRMTNGLVWDLRVIDDKLFCGQAITAFTIDHDGRMETIFNEGTWQHTSLDPSTILMGTYSGLHYLKKTDGRWHYDKRIKGFEGSGRILAVDKANNIWVVRDNGSICRLALSHKDDTVKHTTTFTGTDSARFGNGSTVVRFHDQILFTTTAGLCYYDDKTQKIIPNDAVNNLLRSHGYTQARRIIPADRDQVWIATSEGALVKIRYSNDNPELIESTQRLRGKLITDFEHVNVMDSTVIAGTVEGFAVYQPDVTMKKQPFVSYVSRIETNDQVISNGNYLLTAIDREIPYAENTLRFTFACNAYEELAANQYQYFLEGFGSEVSWSPRTSVAFKEYTNLPPGAYRLHVRAINFEHQPSLETIVAFTILPPWYRSWWSYIIYTIIIAAFIWFLIKRIQQRIERERKRVAQEKHHQLWLKQKEWEEAMLNNQKKMMALQQEKLQIEKAALEEKGQLMEKEKQHAQQMMTLEKEKLEADLRHKSSELSSLTLHITQKNEMLTRIASQLARTIDESRDEVAVKNLVEIKNSLQKGSESSHEWEKFIEHFDNVHEGFLKRLKQRFPDLSTSTLKLCALIRMRLSSKQIATLMNTEPASVLKARYRLRMKFNLAKETGLEEFLNEF